jgi:ClpP class serine protease
MRLLDAVMATPWAIRPEALRAILALASREDISREAVARAMAYTPEGQAAHVKAVSPEAVSARQGRRLPKTKRVEMRGGVAIVPIEGPIFRYAGMFDDVSGASSVQVLAPDFTTALEDPSVTAIMLHVDSPGGEVSGIAEFADMIYAARGRKPITAYVSDLGASAAYWLASAADRIVVAETAALGSIGVVMAVPDPAQREGVDVEFVSSVSPNKRPDPTSEAGRDQYQVLVDTYGDIFVAAVARHRDVSAEIVLADFGAGGLLIGRSAVDAGLADDIGSYEQTVRELSEQAAPAPTVALAPAASVGPARGGRMDRFGKFLAWLDGRDGDGTSAMSAEEIVSDQHTDTKPLPAPAPVAIASPPHQPPATDHAAVRLAELEAENRRLKAAMIHDRATAFAAEQVRDMKAFPAEQDGLVALYAQLAADDEQFGAVATTQGSTTRVTLLGAAMAARPSAAFLTSDRLAPAVAQVLHTQATTPKPGEGPMTEERRASLLGATHLGQAVVNGKSHAN